MLRPYLATGPHEDAVAMGWFVAQSDWEQSDWWQAD